MIEFKVSSNLTGFSAKLFLHQSGLLPETGLIMCLGGQEVGSDLTWLDTLSVMVGLYADTPAITDERFDPRLDTLTILSHWSAEEDSVARSAKPHAVGVFDEYCVMCYRWGNDTVFLAALWGEDNDEDLVLPVKWVLPTVTFREVLFPLCQLNSFILRQSGSGLNDWSGRIKRIRDLDHLQIREPLHFVSRDDASNASLEVRYRAHSGAGTMQLFVAGQRLPVISLFGDEPNDLAILADNVFEVDPERFGELNPHKSAGNLLNTLITHPDKAIGGRVRVKSNEYFQTYVYGWCEETVIAFAPNPFTARSTPDVWVIRNDDFRFMLKCAIDLFGTHTNLFPAEVEPEHGV